MLLAGCAGTVAADPAPITGPATSIAENGAVLIPPLVIEAPPQPTVEAVVPALTTCMDGSPYVEIAGGFVCLSIYHPVAPLTLPEMVSAVGLPPIFRTLIIPRESNWNPRAVNRSSGAICLTQLLGHDGLARSLGYTHQDLLMPWPCLRTSKLLYDAAGLAPWSCSRCSLKPRRHR